jgi:AraC-like DNA-binding protein
MPIAMANSEFLAVHEAFAAHLLRKNAKAKPTASRVQELLEKNILSGRPPEIAAAARELAMSKRSLQAALAQEGSSYRQILNETRRELAKHILEDPTTPICDIAFLLGFSEQSAFNHAFKRWTGQSPREYRVSRTGRRTASS